MVITVLNQKYHCNSNRGISKYEKNGLLDMLNYIIEWDKSEFPKKLKEGGDPKKDEDWIEDREFLGKDPILNPGDMFVTRGQVFAVNDEKTLVLAVSETGWGAAKRLIEEDIVEEFNLFNNFDVDNVTFESSSSDDIPSNFVDFPVSYVKMRLFNKKFKAGRFDKETIIKTTIDESELLVFPTTIYIKPWKISYNPDEHEESDMKLISEGLLSWFYREYERLVVDDIPQNEEEKSEEFNEALKELINELGEENVQKLSKEELLKKITEKTVEKMLKKS